MTTRSASNVVCYLGERRCEVVGIQLQEGLNRLPRAIVEVAASSLPPGLTPGQACRLDIAGEVFELVVSSRTPKPARSPCVARLFMVDPIMAMPRQPIVAEPGRDAEPRALLARAGVETVWAEQQRAPALIAAGLTPAQMLRDCARLTGVPYRRERGGKSVHFGLRDGHAELDVGDVWHVGARRLARCGFGPPPTPGMEAKVDGFAGRVLDIRVWGDTTRTFTEVLVGQPGPSGRLRPCAERLVAAEVSSISPLCAKITVDGATAECPAVWTRRALLGGDLVEELPLEVGDAVLGLIPASGLRPDPLILLPYTTVNEPPSDHRWRSRQPKAEVDTLDLSVKNRFNVWSS